MNNAYSFFPFYQEKDFSQEEYNKILERITRRKQGEYFLADADSIKVVGLIGYIWQRFKELLGAENQTNTFRVTFRFLQLIQYCESHYYDKTQLRSVGQILSEDKKFAPVTQLIQRVLTKDENSEISFKPIANRVIKEFYNVHQSKFQLSFWNRFIHHYILPIQQDIAKFRNAEADIYLEDQDWPNAIQSLKTALEICPNNRYWQFKLALTYAELAKQLPPDQALPQWKKALEISHQIITRSHEKGFTQAVEALKKNTSLACTLVTIQKGQYREAISYFSRIAEKSQIQEALDALESFSAKLPQLHLQKQQQIAFRLAIAQSHLLAEDIFLEFINETERELNREMAVSQGSNREFQQQLTEIQLLKSQYYLRKNQLDQTRLILQQTFAFPEDPPQKMPEPPPSDSKSELEAQAGLDNSPRLSETNEQNNPASELTSPGFEPPPIDSDIPPEDKKLELTTVKQIQKPDQEDWDFSLDAPDPKPEPTILNPPATQKDEELKFQEENESNPTQEPMPPPLIHQESDEDFLESDEAPFTLPPLPPIPIEPAPDWSEIMERQRRLELEAKARAEEEAALEEQQAAIDKRNLLLERQRITLQEKQIALEQNRSDIDELLTERIVGKQQAISRLKKLVIILEQVPFQDHQEGDFERLTKSYTCLAQDALFKQDLAQVKEWCQKGLNLSPQNPSLKAAYAQLLIAQAELACGRGDLEDAIEFYQQAIDFDRNQFDAQEKLIACKLTLADQCYAGGIKGPKQTQQHVLELIDQVRTNNSYANHVEKSLSGGGFFGFFRSTISYPQFLNLATNKNSSIEQIWKDGNTACSSLKKAYSENKMPEDLEKAITHLETELSYMKKYYERLHHRTNTLMAGLKSSNVAGYFSQWTALASSERFQEVQKQTDSALKLIDKANKETHLPEDVLKEKNALQQFCRPEGWLTLAITHYEQAFALDPDSRDPKRGSQLIDAYLQIGDSEGAVVLYEHLKNQFRDSQFTINLEAYLVLAQKPVKSEKITDKQMLNGLCLFAEEQLKQCKFAKALEAYKFAMPIATQTQKKQIATNMLAFADDRINSAYHQLALTAYQRILPHAELLNLHRNPQKLTTIFSLLGDDALHHGQQKEALNYYQQVLSYFPNHEKAHSVLGEIYWQRQDLQKALSHFTEANTLNPQNAEIIERLANIYLLLGDHEYAPLAFEELRQSLLKMIATISDDARSKGLKKFSLFGLGSSNVAELEEIGLQTSTPIQLEQDCAKIRQLIGKIYHNNKPKPAPFPQHLDVKLKEFEEILSRGKHLLQEYWKELPKCLSPSGKGNIQQAIQYYEKVLSYFVSKGIYYPFYGRFIDSLVKIRNSKEAIEWYEDLKQKFPEAPLTINPIAYHEAISAYIKIQRFEDAFELIQKGLIYTNHTSLLLKDKSDLYSAMGQHALERKDIPSALILLTLATQCGANIDAQLTTYIELAKINMGLMYQIENSKSTTLWFNIQKSGKEGDALSDDYSFLSIQDLKQYKSHAEAAIAHLKKAADLSPDNAELAFQLVRLAHNKDDKFDIKPYIQRAIALEPENLSYLYAHLMIMGVETETDRAISNRFKKLGGSILGDDQKYWQTDNPYHFPMK